LQRLRFGSFDRHQVEADAEKFDPKTKEGGHKSLVLDAPVGTIFAFFVEIEGFEFRDRKDTLLWTGKLQAATFRFDVPKGCKRGQHTGIAKIWKDGTPVGRISFQIEVVRDASGARKRPVGKEARHYHACFCSYSSLDQAEMLKRAQGLRATGLETFAKEARTTAAQRNNCGMTAALVKLRSSPRESTTSHSTAATIITDRLHFPAAPHH
jgi:hypothetical protein